MHMQNNAITDIKQHLNQNGLILLNEILPQDEQQAFEMLMDSIYSICFNQCSESSL